MTPKHPPGPPNAMKDGEAFTLLIEHAIATPEGHLRLANAEGFLIGELERNRFNTERAVEIYTFAIDNIVWDWVKKMHLGRLLYRQYQLSKSGKRYAIELTQAFKAKSSQPLEDQRPTRRFLRFLLGA